MLRWIKNIKSKMQYQSTNYKSSIPWKLIYAITFICILCTTYGFAALNTELTISGEAYVRPDSDIRVMGIRFIGTEDEGIEKYQSKYTKDTVSMFINLPTQESTVTYKISIKNNTDKDYGIYSIEGIADNLTYEIKDYKLKDKLCTGTSCNNGNTDDIELTIKYKDGGFNSNNIEYTSKLKFKFRTMTPIKYVNFDDTSSYPKSIMPGENLNIQFADDVDEVQIVNNDKVLNYGVAYTFDNRYLTLNNASDSNYTITNVANFCLKNNITDFDSCLLANDKMIANKNDAIANIKSKTVDFSKNEPTNSFYETAEYNKTTPILIDPDRNYYSSKPTINSTTGYFIFTNKVGRDTVPAIISTESQKYYFCKDTYDGNCGHIYVAYEYEQIDGKYYITRYDRYYVSAGESMYDNSGLYVLDDDDGESYFYRGNVKNNFVSFGGFIWKIIRINGDGSVRLIYNGTSTSHSGGYASIGRYSFNVGDYDYSLNGYMYGKNMVYSDSDSTLSSAFNNATYYFSDDYECSDGSCKLKGNKISLTVGTDNSKILNGDEITSNYKYTCRQKTEDATCTIITEFTKFNSATGTTGTYKYHGYLTDSWETILSNTTDSDAKKVVDSWYEKKILNTTDVNGNLNTDYIVDQVFCNDRSYTTGENVGSIKLDQSISLSSYERIAVDKMPSFKCKNIQDKFTTTTKKGNGNLKYPVALMTADEFFAAGTNMWKKNAFNHLYNGSASGQYTMTPAGLNNTSTSAQMLFPSYDSSMTGTPTRATGFIRPVINITSNVKVVQGSGSAANPYVIILNK